MASVRIPKPYMRFAWKDPQTPATVSTAVFEAADYMGNAVPLLWAAQSGYIREVEQRFATQKDDEGKSWAAWSKGYWHSGTILTKTGALREAVTDPQSYTIDGQRLFIEEDAMFTSYGAAHQFGRQEVEHIEGGLPIRRFMGYSPNLIKNINTLFGRWVDNTVAIYERGGRRYVQRRGPMGRFAPGGVVRVL